MLLIGTANLHVGGHRVSGECTLLVTQHMAVWTLA